MTTNLNEDQQNQFLQKIPIQNSFFQSFNEQFISLVDASYEQYQIEIEDSKTINSFNQDFKKQRNEQICQSQIQMSIESTSDIQRTQDQLCNVEDEQLITGIKNRYQKQLQIKVKRVKQTIKKGQQIRSKKLFYQPINSLFLYQIKLDHKFLIYGFLLIEDNYPDYESQYDFNLINQFDTYMSVQSLQKDISNQLFSFTITPIVENIMKKFTPLCYYYDNCSNPSLKQLAKHLRKYEDFISDQDYQFKMISEKYTEEELEKYYEIYFEESNKYTKTCSVDEFMQYTIFKYNMKGKQLEPIKSGTSFALLNLLGLYIETLDIFLKKYNSLMDPVGMSRIESALTLFQFINSGKNELIQEDKFKTIDDIVINAQLHHQYFSTDKIPEDVNKVFKCQCVITRFNIDIKEIEKIIKQRGNLLQSIYNNIFEECVFIENVVMNELFLEKYYPETFQKLKGNNNNNNVAIAFDNKMICKE